MSLISKSTSLIIFSAIVSLLTGTSVLFHDTEFDRFTTRAIDNPKIAVLQQLAEPYRNNEHSQEQDTIGEALHSVTSSQPRLQTRLAEDRRYLNPKKIYINLTHDDLS